MAEQTTSESRLDRDEVGSALRRLADAFEGGGEEIDVEVGNKDVTLSPRETVTYEIEVTERNSKLRKDREAIELDLSWKTR